MNLDSGDWSKDAKLECAGKMAMSTAARLQLASSGPDQMPEESEMLVCVHVHLHTKYPGVLLRNIKVY